MRRCRSAFAGSVGVERRCGACGRLGGFGARSFLAIGERIVPIPSHQCRPTPSLPFVGPMVIVALILGLALGALAVGARALGVRRARARRDARRARRRAPLVRRQGRQCRPGRFDRRVSGEQLGVPRDRGDQADRLRPAAEGVAREGRRPGADVGAGARARYGALGTACSQLSERTANGSPRRSGRRMSGAAGARFS